MLYYSVYLVEEMDAYSFRLDWTGLELWIGRMYGSKMVFHLCSNNTRERVCVKKILFMAFVNVYQAFFTFALFATLLIFGADADDDLFGEQFIYSVPSK